MILLLSTLALACAAPRTLTFSGASQVWVRPAYSGRSVTFVVDGVVDGAVDGVLPRAGENAAVRRLPSGLSVLRYAVPQGGLAVKALPIAGSAAAHVFRLACTDEPSRDSLEALRLGDPLHTNDERLLAAEQLFLRHDPGAKDAYSALADDRALRPLVSLRLADIDALDDRLGPARRRYEALAKEQGGDLGGMAAASALELGERLGKAAEQNALEGKVRRALESEQTDDAQTVERDYRIARWLLTRGDARAALPLTLPKRATPKPLAHDMRRQGLLDAALRETFLDAFLAGDDVRIAETYAAYGSLVGGHGDAVWLETLIAHALLGLDLAKEALAVLGETPDARPLVSRELLAAEAAIDIHQLESARLHLEQLRPFVELARAPMLEALLARARPKEESKRTITKESPAEDRR